jgi:phage-related protein
MKVIHGLNSKRKTHQIAVPMTPEELNRLEAYLAKSGFKKGRFVQQAILEKLAREEQA